MTGVVLAAGAGRRLRGLTAELPKTLLAVSDGRTILDVVLSNFSAVGIERAVVVTGFAAERVRERVPALERRHGLEIDLRFNARAKEWNNAFSLWLARDVFPSGAMLANGDTVHPSSVEETLLAADPGDLLLAVDDRKPLGAEEMKVVLSENGRVRHIRKQVEPPVAVGEYIGVALIAPTAAQSLAEALEATWQRDPELYYEDAFEELAARGGDVRAAPIGDVDWVEVDTDADFARAREIGCRF
jgi:choline kinase